MRPGLANIIAKVCFSRHFEWPETDIHIAENVCCIEYADTWSSKHVHWLSNSQSTNRITTYYGCENTVELDTEVGWVSLPSTRIHPQVAWKSKIQQLPDTLHNSGWMDLCEVRHGSFQTIPILDRVDVKKAYGDSASCHHCLQWHGRSHGWHYTSVG